MLQIGKGAIYCVRSASARADRINLSSAKNAAMSCNEYIMGLLISCMVWTPARADWVNLSGAENASTIAEICIQEDHVQLVIEPYEVRHGVLVGVKDLEAWMIWEDEPLPERVKELETMGIRSIVFSSCGNRLEQGVFMTVMKMTSDWRRNMGHLESNYEL